MSVNTNEVQRYFRKQLLQHMKESSIDQVTLDWPEYSTRKQFDYDKANTLTKEVIDKACQTALQKMIGKEEVKQLPFDSYGKGDNFPE